MVILMYINFSNIHGMIETLDKVISCLVKSKEKIEYERWKLAQNSELDDVLADMKMTVRRLEDKIVTSKKLKFSLVRISEMYISCEDDVKDKVEGIRANSKSEYAYFRKLPVDTDLRWIIK